MAHESVVLEVDSLHHLSNEALAAQLVVCREHGDVGTPVSIKINICQATIWLRDHWDRTLRRQPRLNLTEDSRTIDS